MTKTDSSLRTAPEGRGRTTSITKVTARAMHKPVQCLLPRGPKVA